MQDMQGYYGTLLFRSYIRPDTTVIIKDGNGLLLRLFFIPIPQTGTPLQGMLLAFLKPRARARMPVRERA